jgi:hypothetical protein
MMMPPPLSPELEALLAPHRQVVPVAPSIAARAVARAAAVRESPEPSAIRVRRRPSWVFAAAAGVVLAAGAGAYAARGWIGLPSFRGQAQLAPIAMPSASAPRAPAVVSDPREPETPATTAQETPPRKRVARKTSAAMVPPTNAELQLLRDARQDVTRGDFARALAVIGEHARRFRNGSLVEEREALRVKSLAGLGRHEEAQRAAARFHARFPHSVFLSTFERMNEGAR